MGRIILRACAVVAMGLAILNVASYTLARVHGHNWAYIVKLPGAVHIIDVPLDEPGATASLYVPSVGLGTFSIAFVYRKPLGFAGTRQFLPFFHLADFGGPFLMLSIAYWPLIVLFAVPPTLALAHRQCLTRYRQKHGWCLRCGYDLASNMSSVCPECGTPVERQNGSKTGDRNGDCAKQPEKEDVNG
mgnify:CR=1 FL=1